MAFSFPSEVGGTKLEWWHGVSLSLGCIEVETEECINMRAICGWAFVVKSRESVVNFADLGGFDQEKNSLDCDVLVVLIN